MPRKGSVKKRQINPDPIYNSRLVEKFVNKLMREGKKEVARKIAYGVLSKASQELAKDPLAVLEQALLNVTPRQEVRSRRVGGATYQIPRPVKPDRGQSLALRWMIEAARAKKGRPMVERLSEELIADYRGEGGAVKKKEDVHKIAEANRAFAHFRW